MSAPVTIPPATAHAAELVAARQEGFVRAWRYTTDSPLLTARAYASDFYPWPRFRVNGDVPTRVPVEDGSGTFVAWMGDAVSIGVFRSDPTLLGYVLGCVSHRSIAPVRAAAAKLLLAEPVSVEYECQWVDGTAVAVPVTGA